MPIEPKKVKGNMIHAKTSKTPEIGQILSLSRFNRLSAAALYWETPVTRKRKRCYKTCYVFSGGSIIRIRINNVCYFFHSCYWPFGGSFLDPRSQIFVGTLANTLGLDYILLITSWILPQFTRNITTIQSVAPGNNQINTYAHIPPV